MQLTCFLSLPVAEYLLNHLKSQLNEHKYKFSERLRRLGNSSNFDSEVCYTKNIVDTPNENS